ncbi:MAG: hypothetical protein A3D92_14320 [Bacteroidetes bacterium RIFCSPHIGHO2_02_FULL_44_7]|nr:MAG: hypothetical protein A3D92_14320 [Bacteroidetes bacterium RIFCSPHIGHO2_02_FULL_44_7]
MTIKIMLKENYLTMIKNAAKGQNFMFRNFFIIQDGIEKDALEDGGLACSAFASSILYLQNPVLEFLKKLKWIESTHANTESTVKDMLKNGWYEIKDFRPGAVLVWEEEQFPHIGFCVSETEAVSNDSKGTGFPWKHHITYDGTRKIEKIYWHPELDKN